jgi:hypothetical protein
MYIPIMKLKLGELDGLKNLPNEFFENNKVIPLFEILSADHEPMTIKKKPKLPRKLFFDCEYGHCWEDRQSIFLDEGVAAIPVFNANFPGHDLSRADSLPESCIRISPFLIPEVVKHLSNYNNVHLLIDFGDIKNINNQTICIQMSLLKELIEKPWKSVTVAGTSFPENMGNIQRGMTFHRRREFSDLYTIFKNRYPSVQFGDYTITHPKLLEDFNPKTMDSAAKIKYSTDAGYYIFKGKGTKSAGFHQYHKLAQSLIKENFYSGETYSWGDGKINKIATDETSGPGSKQTWVSIGLNHHVHVIINQLSS